MREYAPLKSGGERRRGDLLGGPLDGSMAALGRLKSVAAGARRNTYDTHGERSALRSQ
jgi:hypothetical protein